MMAIRFLILLCLASGLYGSVSLKAYRANEAGKRAVAQGHFEDAVDAFALALSEVPNSGEIRVNMGHLLMAMDDPKRATAFYEQAKSYLPNAKHAELYYHLGNVAALGGDYSAAKAAYIQSMKLDPSDLDPKWNYEWILAQEASGGESKPPQLMKDQEALAKLREQQQNLNKQQREQHAQLLQVVENQEKEAQMERAQTQKRKANQKNDW